TANTTQTAELETHEPADPLVGELEQRRRELALVQNRLSDQLRLLDESSGKEAPQEQWAALETHRHRLEEERATLDREAAQRGHILQAAALSGADLRERSRRLMDEIKAMDKLPPVKKTFQYKTPISQPVQAEELLFECRDGRVAFIDIGAMLR